jgi:hypothetical protein
MTHAPDLHTDEWRPVVNEHQIFTSPQTVKEWLQQPDEEPEVEFLSPRWPTRAQLGHTSTPSADEASTAETPPSPKTKQ